MTEVIEEMVLQYMIDYATEHQVVPSYEEIREQFCLSSKSNVFRLVRSMADMGLIVLPPSPRPRGYTIPGGRWVYEPPEDEGDEAEDEPDWTEFHQACEARWNAVGEGA